MHLVLKEDTELINIFKAGINYISALFICFIKFNYDNIIDYKIKYGG